jgi:hypothetical protein
MDFSFYKILKINNSEKHNNDVQKTLKVALIKKIFLTQPFNK